MLREVLFTRHASAVLYLRKHMVRIDSKFFSSSSKVAFKCSTCGKETAKWHGRCTGCQSWGTLREFEPVVTQSGSGISKSAQRAEATRSRWLSQPAMSKSDSPSPMSEGKRLVFEDPELMRVFGGGVVPGSVTLLSGNPGVGKSKFE